MAGLTSSPSLRQSTEARPRRRSALIAVATFATVVTAAAATHAFSQGTFEPAWSGPGFIRGPRSLGARLDSAQAEDRADRLVRHLAIEIDATPQQQERLREIVKSAARDLIPMRDRAQAGRERVGELLTQSMIDRAALEAVRSDQMTLADTASKRIMQALADAAEVLTPEQRRKIDERISAWRLYRQRWSRW